MRSKIIIDGVENFDVGAKNHHRWARKSSCWCQKSPSMGLRILMLVSKIIIDGVENLHVGVKNRCK
jgi:hypothetical protein